MSGNLSASSTSIHDREKFNYKASKDTARLNLSIKLLINQLSMQSTMSHPCLYLTLIHPNVKHRIQSIHFHYRNTLFAFEAKFSVYSSAFFDSNQQSSFDVT